MWAIHVLGYLFSDDNLLSFQVLREILHIPKQHVSV